MASSAVNHVPFRPNLNVNVEEDAVSASPVPEEFARCLSPGPAYNGPEIDRSSLPWPLASCPDWPINDDWRDFAFAPVEFSSKPLDIDPIPDNSDLET